jgi:sugar phosphate permease
LLLPVLALMPSFALAGAVYTLRLVVQRLGIALRQSFVMSSAPADERARVGAFAQLPTQGAAALAPMLTGYLFTEVSLALPFELAGVLQLINAALFQHYFGAREEPGGGQ